MSNKKELVKLIDKLAKKSKALSEFKNNPLKYLQDHNYSAELKLLFEQNEIEENGFALLGTSDDASTIYTLFEPASAFEDPQVDSSEAALETAPPNSLNTPSAVSGFFTTVQSQFRFREEVNVFVRDDRYKDFQRELPAKGPGDGAYLALIDVLEVEIDEGTHHRETESPNTFHMPPNPLIIKGSIQKLAQIVDSDKRLFVYEPLRYLLITNPSDKIAPLEKYVQGLLVTQRDNNPDIGNVRLGLGQLCYAVKLDEQNKPIVEDGVIYFYFAYIRFFEIRGHYISRTRSQGES